MTKRSYRLAFTAALSGLALGALSAPAAAQTPPPQPGLNQLGGAGPCTQGTRVGGYGSFNQYNWVHVPVGTGSPRTGGTCNDSSRPVIFIAPGNLVVNSLPSLYGDLIDNMVSNGYIVVYSNYAGTNPNPAYGKIFSGFQYAASTLNASSGYRMDLTNIGVWGHSFGAGAIPWIAQQIPATGWGSNSMWFAMNATSYVYLNGTSAFSTTGSIPMPSNAHVQLVAYNDDDVVDQGWAIDVFNSITTTASKKHIIQIEPDGTYKAQHTEPSGNSGSHDYITYYGVYKNYQALGDCARFGTNCATSVLTNMGQFSSPTRAATPAIVDASPLVEIYHSGGPTGPTCGVPPGNGQAVRAC